MSSFFLYKKADLPVEKGGVILYNCSIKIMGKDKMLKIKKAISILLVLALAFSLSACGKSNKAIIYFELESVPLNLDPQTAREDSELLIIRNLFEGLMRKNAEGELVEGACSAYEKSGLKYTFTLREGLKWSDDTPLLAEDFVFALRRAVQKSTSAPFVNRLFSIAGAREIYENGADVKTLGVRAAGNKVVITLKEEDPDFLETLSTSVAMPCSEKYFLETEGKYGQDAKSLLCNGSYDIFKWNREDFAVRLYKNDYYKGAYEAVNGGVFFSCVEEKNQVSRLNDNESDMAFLSPLEIKEAKKQDITIKQVENICWFLTLGDCYDQSTKAALLSAFSSNIYSDNLGEGLRPADSIYPAVLSVNNCGGVGMPTYNIDNAKINFSNIIKNMPDKKFPTSTLYYYDRPEIKTAVNTLLGHWQQNLSAFINMQSSTSLDALLKELSNKSLQFSLFPVTAHNASVEEYMESLNLTGDTAEAQARFLGANNIVPFAFQSTSVAYSSSIKTVYMDNGNGYIDFAFVYKKE